MNNTVWFVEYIFTKQTEIIIMWNNSCWAKNRVVEITFNEFWSVLKKDFIFGVK